jgi:hypothetical protein
VKLIELVVGSSSGRVEAISGELVPPFAIAELLAKTANQATARRKYFIGASLGVIFLTGADFRNGS